MSALTSSRRHTSDAIKRPDRGAENRLRHALSFDIEDWFHIMGIQVSEDPSQWPRLPSIVEGYTREILATLAEYETQATFFVLGWVAERYPSIVAMLADHGHEIGTHSFWHRKVYDLSPDEFYDDLLDSIEVLEQHEGVRVHGFRAPSFSIVPGTEWAFDVMKKCGLSYDASLFPAARAHGGYPCPLGPCLVRGSESGSIAELPMSVFAWGPIRFCFTGGGYFRIVPGFLIQRGIELLERNGRPAVVYLHPRDIAVECPTAPMPPHRHFKCYVGRRTALPKLRRLLARHEFTTCHDVLKRSGLLAPRQPSAKLGPVRRR